MQSLYEQLKIAGCALDHHESDLYCRVTPESRLIVAAYEARGGITNKTFFCSQIDGRTWFDFPFMYTPYWEAKAGAA